MQGRRQSLAAPQGPAPLSIARRQLTLLLFCNIIIPPFHINVVCTVHKAGQSRAAGPSAKFNNRLFINDNYLSYRCFPASAVRR
jgi:hypothetical protein